MQPATRASPASLPPPSHGEASRPATEAVELMELSLVSDDLGTFTVPLDGPGTEVPYELPEGTVVSTALTFRLGADTDGLVFETIRIRAGEAPVTRRIALGSFRTGGPYEIRLPPERLPLGRTHCGTYEVTARLSDADGLEHARVRHLFTIVRRLPDGVAEADDPTE
ncbi:MULTISPECIES: hypothetical protein [unclassified Streptomyces]|uniref:hypothetical protein n=1 Tax=unclassified Streptomyces TaxID=2593676 RepID=UPI002966FDFB|nr:hypothetical protein [Streptomyces sp. SJL17-1]